MMDERILVGKTVARVDIDRSEAKIVFTDGTVLWCNASDNCYLDWDIYKSNDHVHDEE